MFKTPSYSSVIKIQSLHVEFIKGVVCANPVYFGIIVTGVYLNTHEKDIESSFIGINRMFIYRKKSNIPPLARRGL